MSLTGAHFSQQLFKVDPSLGSLSRDYYRQFYAENFEDGHVRIEKIYLEVYILWTMGGTKLCCKRFFGRGRGCFPDFFLRQ